MEQAKLPVAFFDSGLGGISVLREAVRLLPGEDYLYFGDSLHAPYGIRTPEDVLRLTRLALEAFLAEGIKALVIACNTATSAAAAQLRLDYPQLPIIGAEPAIKPAAEAFPGGRILMLATPMTTREEKFHRLHEKYAGQAQIIPIPCEGLMEYVEQGILEGSEVESYLAGKLSAYLDEPVDAVVLGCTHYPFLRGAIRNVVGPKPVILDGSRGIAEQLRRQLTERHLLNPQETGRVEIQNSLNDPAILALARRLLETDPAE